MYVEDLLRSLVARDHLEYTWAWVWAVLRCFQRPYRAYFFSSMNSQQSIRIHLHNLGKSKLQDKQGEGRPKAVHAGASGHGEPQFLRPWKEPKSPQRDKDPCFYSRNAPPQKKKPMDATLFALIVKSKAAFQIKLKILVSPLKFQICKVVDSC